MESKVICLCGSTKFTDDMLLKQWELTKQGNVVLSWCALPEWYYKLGEEHAHVGDQEGVKAIVDEVHKCKIDIADEVFIMNVGGYIGDSTKAEITYALEQGKPVNWLEPDRKWEPEHWCQPYDGDIHEYFGLSYANYLVLPRTALQSMPLGWQKKFVECLRQLGYEIDFGPKWPWSYHVTVRNRCTDRFGSLKEQETLPAYDKGRTRVPLNSRRK